MRGAATSQVGSVEVTGAEPAWGTVAEHVGVTGAERVCLTRAEPVGVSGAKLVGVTGAEPAGVCVMVQEDVGVTLAETVVTLASVEAEECTSSISSSEKSSSSKETIV